MHLMKNHLFTLLRRFLETIDIVAKKRRIDVNEASKLCDVYLRMS